LRIQANFGFIALRVVDESGVNPLISRHPSRIVL
jgi:hypothetical protein